MVSVSPVGDRGRAIARFKLWYRVHKWTSLVCTAFLLMLCLTGLPLIFFDELDELLGNRLTPAPVAEGTPPAAIESVIAAGLARHPGWVVQYVVWDRDEPNVILLNVAARRPAPRGTQRIEVVDAHTAEVLGEKKLYEGVLYFVRQLHKDMFAGLPGSLLLGGMGILFCASIVSGVLLYGPFMRKLAFGTLRFERQRRIKWLDMHNLLGIATVAWVSMVGLTGSITTLSDPIFRLWQREQTASMLAPYRDRSVPAALASIDQVIATVRQAFPGTMPSYVAFPGMPAAGPDHFMVSMRGDTPLTSRLPRAVLIDSVTAEIVDVRAPPWYLSVLLLSQPLHFGDYGGMPLKIIWAMLDIVTIVVLGSGLYLWLSRRRSPLGMQLAELEELANES